MKIDFHSDESNVLLNPRLPKIERERLLGVLKSYFSKLKGHIWLTTSGTTGNGPKWVALSKEAVIASAIAVNEHLQCTKKDVWVNPLPHFHVGGLGIFARTYASGAKVVDYNSVSTSGKTECTECAENPKWNPTTFWQCLMENKATLTAIVPAQVYDLIACNLTAPSNLRAVVVGGGALNESLYNKANELGWKLLPSYGLTEAASQVATAEIGSWEKNELPSLKILSHMQISINDEGFICLKGNSLLTAYVCVSCVNEKEVDSQANYYDPRNSKSGYFQTEDKGEIHGNYLKVLGRDSSYIKIGGESVNMNRLEQLIEQLKLDLQLNGCCDLAVVAVPDKRLGHVINLVVAGISVDSPEVVTLVNCYQTQVLPFEKIRQIRTVSKIPRTSLQKLCKPELLQILSTFL